MIYVCAILIIKKASETLKDLPLCTREIDACCDEACVARRDGSPCGRAAAPSDSNSTFSISVSDRTRFRFLITGAGGEGNVGDKKRRFSGVTRETDSSSFARGDDHTSSASLGVCVRRTFEGEECDTALGERLLDAERGLRDGFREGTWSCPSRSHSGGSDASATSLSFIFPLLFVDGLVGEGRSTPPSSPGEDETFCGLEVFRGVNSTYALCFGVRPLDVAVDAG